MTLRPVRARAGGRWIRLDRHWLRSITFTLFLVGLIAAAIGADWTSALSSLVTCAVGFGFFYLLFPGGAHFGMTVANFLAIYACMFEFFRDANFPAASREAALIAVALPVLGFLGGCIVRRRQVLSIIHARRIRELQHLPRITGWLSARWAWAPHRSRCRAWSWIRKRKGLPCLRRWRWSHFSSSPRSAM